MSIGWISSCLTVIATVGGVAALVHFLVKGILVSGQMRLASDKLSDVFRFYMTALDYVVQIVESRYRERGAFYAVSLIAAISITYTIAFFFLGWTVGGSGAIGNVQVLPPFDSELQRFGFTVAYLLLAAITVILVVNDNAIHRHAFGVFRVWPTKLVCGVAAAAAIYVTWTDVVPNLPYEVPSFLAWVGVTSNGLLEALKLFASGLALLAAVVSRNPITVLNFAIVACFGYWADLPLTVFFPLALVFAWPISGPIPMLLSVFVCPFLIGLLAMVFPLDIAIIIGAFFPAYVAIILAGSGEKTAKRVGILMAIGFIELLPMGIGVHLRGYELGLEGALSITFLWSVLPFLNVGFDLLSWFITWLLLAHLLKSFVDYHGDVAGRLRIAGGHMLIDLAFAIVLIPTTIVVLIFFVGFYNQFLSVAGVPLTLDLSSVFQSGSESPFGPESMWFSVVIFSTLLPTALHFVVAIAGLLFSFIPPKARLATQVVVSGPGVVDGYEIERAAYRITLLLMAALTAMLLVFYLLSLIFAALGSAPSLTYQFGADLLRAN